MRVSLSQDRPPGVGGRVASGVRVCSLLLATGDGQEELEFWGQLVFGVEPVGEIDSSNSGIKGGGLYIVNSTGEKSVTISNSKIERSESGIGGGLYIINSKVNMNDVKIKNNKVQTIEIEIEGDALTVFGYGGVSM